MGKINRITLFKIPDEEDLEAALAAYTKLEANNSKVSKHLPQRNKPFAVNAILQRGHLLYVSPRTASHTFSP
jgi:hypothetical protein